MFRIGEVNGLDRRSLMIMELSLYMYMLTCNADQLWESWKFCNRDGGLLEFG